jgi:chromosome partitioning protein
MKSVAIVSQKGGVGKTTLALNLGFSLAKLGLRVVLVDADPQGGIGHSLKGAGDSPGLAGFATHGTRVREALLRTRLAEFKILPVGNVQPEFTQDFATQLADGTVLATAMDELSPLFDVALIDTPAGFNGVTLGALRACDWALSPVQAEPVALRTLPQLLSVIGALREQGAHVELVGLVLSMLQQRNADSLAVAEEVWSRLPADLVFETTIPRDPAVLAASSAGTPLALTSRLHLPPVALCFDQLAAEFAGRSGILTGEADEPLSLFA